MPYYPDGPLWGIPKITFGKRPKPRMLAEEKVSKKRMGNPALWAQLEAISKGTYVNHIPGKKRYRPQ